MDRNNANKSIRCTVEQCRNHCDCADYCALSEIHVGTHEPNPTETQCVDYNSFELRH